MSRTLIEREHPDLSRPGREALPDTTPSREHGAIPAASPGELRHPGKNTLPPTACWKRSTGSSINLRPSSRR